MKSRNKLLIVDGYNVLRSGSRYRHMRAMADYTDEVYNKCREALINDVIAHMGRDYCEAYLVFDDRGARTHWRRAGGVFSSGVIS